MQLTFYFLGANQPGEIPNSMIFFGIGNSLHDLLPQIGRLLVQMVVVYISTAGE